MSRFAHARAWAVVPVLLALSLAGCGFEPVHGQATRARFELPLNAISIETDRTPLAQLLRAEIEDGINPGANREEHLFRLTIGLTETETSLFINPDGTSSRGDIVFSSQYSLARAKDGKVVDTGSLSRLSSYNISENADYATYVSREDARKRAVIELAQDYKLRLANLLPKINDPHATPNPPQANNPQNLILPGSLNENFPARP